MRVIVTGISEVPATAVSEALFKSHLNVSELVTTPGNGGVSVQAERWAKVHGVPVVCFDAQWHRGPAAIPERNQRMTEYADALVAVWDGAASDVWQCIAMALQSGLTVYIHHLPLTRRCRRAVRPMRRQAVALSA
jgi:hypothetical protein